MKVKMLFLQPNINCMPMNDKHGISIRFGAVRKIFCMCNELYKIISKRKLQYTRNKKYEGLISHVIYVFIPT